MFLNKFTLTLTIQLCSLFQTSVLLTKFKTGGNNNWIWNQVEWKPNHYKSISFYAGDWNTWTRNRNLREAGVFPLSLKAGSVAFQLPDRQACVFCVGLFRGYINYHHEVMDQGLDQHATWLCPEVPSCRQERHMHTYYPLHSGVIRHGEQNDMWTCSNRHKIWSIYGCEKLCYVNI